MLWVVTLAIGLGAPIIDDGEAEVALKGLDPVALLKGEERPGREEFEVVHHTYRYRFASAEHRDSFLAAPEDYGIQWGGSCGGMGLLCGVGAVDRYDVWDGRIWIFASDACREGFRRDPASLMPRVDPLPAADEQSMTLGRLYLDEFVQTLGGDLFDELEEYVETTRRTVESGGREYRNERSVKLTFPGAAQLADAWDDDRWTETADPKKGVRGGPDGETPMVEAQRLEVLRIVSHHPLWIARQRDRDNFLAVYTGSEMFGGGRIHKVMVHFGGNATELAFDPDSYEVRWARFRDRATGKVGRFGDVEVRYDDWRDVDGLWLPFGRVRTFNGKKQDDRSLPLGEIEVRWPGDRP